MSARTLEDEGRDDPYWARPMSKLTTAELPADAINLNVEGRQVVGPLQGFGQMWQKTYRVRLSGLNVPPTQVIARWKKNFPRYWPEGSRFYSALTEISPGEVAVLNLPLPGGLRVATGIRVIYADDESFSFMTPQGHMFCGMNTFSAYDEDGVTVAQIQLLVRASDPFYEFLFRIGLVSKMEDQFWHHTLRSLARDFGVSGQIQQHSVLVDNRIQWSEAKNFWHNAAIRSALYAPIAMVRRVFGRDM
jgi:hypothetical protein